MAAHLYFSTDGSFLDLERTRSLFLWSVGHLPHRVIVWKCSYRLWVGMEEKKNTVRITDQRWCAWDRWFSFASTGTVQIGSGRFCPDWTYQNYFSCIYSNSIRSSVFKHLEHRWFDETQTNVLHAIWSFFFFIKYTMSAKQHDVDFPGWGSEMGWREHPFLYGWCVSRHVHTDHYISEMIINSKHSDLMFKVFFAPSHSALPPLLDSDEVRRLVFSLHH